MAKTTKTRQSDAARKARRELIAKAVVEQKPTRQIAAELGVSRKTVWQEAKAPETQALVQSWMKPHHESIKRMIPRALAAVNKGLKPSQEMRDRLAAVKTLGTVMEWTEGKVNGDSGDARFRRGQFELVELLEMYAKFPVTTPEA